MVANIRFLLPTGRSDQGVAWRGEHWPLWQRLLLAFALAALLAGVSLWLHSVFPAHVVWLAGGAAVAVAALWGPALLPAAGAGTALSAWWSTGDAGAALGFGVLQTVLAGIGWGLLKWPWRLRLPLQKLGTMARFILVCGAGYAVAGAVLTAVVPDTVQRLRGDAAGSPTHAGAHAAMEHGAARPAHGSAPHGTAAHAEAHAASPLHVGSGRLQQALADMLGVLLVAPALWCALRAGRVPQESEEADPRGALVALALLLAMALGIYSGWIERTFAFRHTTLLVLPPAVWLALRHPMPYTLFGNLAVVLISDVGTSLGQGPFSDHTSGLSILHLVFVGTTLLMAASQCERVLAGAEVQRLATRDALTDLPNRNLLALRLETALATAQRYQRRVAVLFIDLDHFKRINDSLGHATGDRLLVAAAERIASVLRADSLLARVGGDEFVAVMEQLQDTDDLSRAAARIISALEHPFAVGPHLLTISCSVGVATYPDDGASGSELVKHADIAMYEAKSTGRNHYRFFSPAMNRLVRERLEVENGLRAALQQADFVLHYQPICSAADGRMLQVEALLRWRRADGSLVAPGEFMHVAEETGLIEGIGSWVIAEAARQLQQWRAEGLETVPVCVNLSVRQLRNPRALSEHVRQTLQQHGLQGSDLVLEITETMLLHLGGEAEEALKQLSYRGIALALDDFGTGYSSLGYLARLPIDTLKVDRCFVHEMLERPAQLRLVKAMVELAHLLQMRVVAEGVEIAPQRDQLVALGIDQLQGHLIAPALEAQAFARQWLRAAATAAS